MLLSCVWDYGENNNSRDRVMTSMCFVIIMFRCVFPSWKQLYLCEMVDMCCMNAFSVSAEVSWVGAGVMFVFPTYVTERVYLRSRMLNACFDEK